jgi:hypothetical protein
MIRKLSLLALLVALTAPIARADGGGQDPPYNPYGGGSSVPIGGTGLLVDGLRLLLQVGVL